MSDSQESPDYEAPEPHAAVAMESRAVTMTSVIVHPGNPRKNFGDLTELEESIREVGVLQPPVVLPAPRVAAAWPEYAEKFVGAEWVVLMGARRRTAAGTVYGDGEEVVLPVLIREDVIADDRLGQLDVMTAENIARQALSAVEEARSFDEQVKAGRSQREIAARMGCSQGHVSKRLKLLRLPAQMVKEIENGKLDIVDALAYAEADDHFVMLAAHKLCREQSWRTPAAAVKEVRAALERQAAVEAATKKLAEEGVPAIESASAKFGGQWWERELRTDRAIAKARKAGHLVAEVGGSGRITYYSSEKPKRADNRTAAEQERLDRDRAEKLAKKARDEACARLVAAAPKVPETGAVPMLVDAVLAAVHGDAGKLAMRWLRDAGVVDLGGLSPWQFGQALRTKPWTVRAAAAYALSLGQQETHARWTNSKWNAADAAYVRMLADQAGYVITEYDQTRLDAVPAEEDDPDEPADHVDQADDGTTATGEYRLWFAPADGGSWVVVNGNYEPIADNDGLTSEMAEEACYWAKGVLADLGVTAYGWQARAGADDTVEYIADLTGEC